MSVDNLNGKMVVLHSQNGQDNHRGFIYHVDLEKNLALAFWDRHPEWSNEISLTILTEWFTMGWCYLTETTGV